MPTLEIIRTMVNQRPASSRARTSPKPTVVRVMMVMYSESRSGQPSRKWYPSMPNTLSPTSSATMRAILLNLFSYALAMAGRDRVKPRCLF